MEHPLLVGVGQGVGDLGADPGHRAVELRFGSEREPTMSSIASEPAAAVTGSEDSERTLPVCSAGGETGIRDGLVDRGRQRGRSGGRPGVAVGPGLLERAGHERTGQGHGTARDGTTPAASVSSDRGAALPSRQAAEPPQVVDDRVQAVPMDELHGIVVHSLVLAHAVDRHDVAMVQPPGRARFELEPLELGGAEPPGQREDLERDMAAQRLLHGLVDDPHASPRDLAENPEIAELAPCGPDEIGRRTRVRPAAGRSPLGDRLDSFHHQERGEEVDDGFGQLRVLAGVLGERGTFAPSLPLHELLGQHLDGISVGTGGQVGLGHASSSSHRRRLPKGS